MTLGEWPTWSLGVETCFRCRERLYVHAAQDITYCRKCNCLTHRVGLCDRRTHSHLMKVRPAQMPLLEEPTR